MFTNRLHITVRVRPCEFETVEFRRVTDDEVAGVRLTGSLAASRGAFNDVIAIVVGGRRAALLAVP